MVELKINTVFIRQVAQLKMEDAGNYSCVLRTPLAMSATTRVHVLQGEIKIKKHLLDTLTTTTQNTENKQQQKNTDNTTVQNE